MIIKQKNKIDTPGRSWLNQYELLFFAIISVAGIASSLLSYSLLDNYPYNFGKGVLGLFVAPVLTVFYLTITGFIYGFNGQLLSKALILYFIQIIPFAPLFFKYSSLLLTTILAGIICMLKIL